MTDKAFSDLTSASALNDADIFAITQSGTSKKIASSVVKTYMQEGFTPISTTTLTNKTVDLTNNTLTGTIAQFNSALSGADFCTIAGSETITNKTLTTPILSATVSGTTSGRLGYLSGSLSYGDGTNQQTVATLDRAQTFTAAQSFSGKLGINVTPSAATDAKLQVTGGTTNVTTLATAYSLASIAVVPKSTSGYSLAVASGTGDMPLLQVSANGSAAGDLLIQPYGGNVGIGTASPSRRLTINNSSSSYIGYKVADVEKYVTGVDASTSFIVYDSTAAANRLVLDAAGNLGIGVTPTTGWSGVGSVLQVGANAALIGGVSGGTASLIMNAYYDGITYRYINAAAASRLAMTSGAYSFQQVSSGAAGAPLTFTTAMTLDASGNLGIGTSSPTAAGAGYVNLTLNGSTSSFMDLRSNGGGVGRIQADNANSFGIANIAGGSGYTHFDTNGSERMRIDSSGRLLVGTTSSPVGGALFRAYNAANADFSFGPNGSSSFIVYNSSSVGVYLSNGTQAWAGSSDERLKTDLITITNAIQKVATLRAVTGRFKTDAEGFSRAFLIAQDVQKVLPEAVDSEDPERLGVRYTDTIPLLVKAIQELSAEIETLKQRIK